MNKKALVVDGNSLLYRSYYATLNQLTYYQQHNLAPVNALKLFLLSVLKLISNEKYDYFFIAFDHQKKTNRHEIFADYKSKRKPMPSELVGQIELIKQGLDLLGIVHFSQEGIEADDLIGSLANIASSQNINVEIYSSDRDLLQLINKNTNINLFKSGVSETYKVTINNFSEFYMGLTPEQVIDFKGISGDTSDNLCGVKGVGDVIASKLLKEYKTLDNIYLSLDKLSENLKNKFIASKEQAFLCRSLAKIETNLFDNKNIEEFKRLNYDINKFKEFIEKYHFTGFDKYL